MVWETLNFLSVLYVLFFWLAQFVDHRSLENFRLVDTTKGRVWKALWRIFRGASEADRSHQACVMTRAFYLLMSMITLLLVRMLLVVPAIRA